MGRRPNALILNFFERGPKLDDQSNRYIHTCKRCNLVFAKGRPDTLQRHLFEQCPNITPADREAVFALASDQASAAGVAPVNHLQSQFRGSNLDHHPQQSSLALERQASALDTLAEVSRQRLDSSAHLPQSRSITNHFQQSNDDSLESGWYASLQDRLETANNSDRDSSYQPPPSADAEQSDLVLTSETPHQNVMHQVDPQLQDIADLSVNHVMSPVSAEAPADVSADMHAPSSTPARFFGLLQRPPKKASRTRFTNERRHQVEGLRKIGACMRCRMLKKPCSPGTPCSTCSSIETARRWKATCIRTRLAEELTLYNTAYFAAKSQYMVNAALLDKDLQKQPGRIEATLFGHGQLYASFLPMAASDRTKSNGADCPPPGVLMIDFENDHVTSKLERYLVDVTDEVVSDEASHFVKVTMKTATALISTSGDILLAEVINLWVATQVLTQSLTRDWIMSYSSDHAPSEEPTVIETAGRELEAGAPDYLIIKAQLMDATERYCAHQSKSVLNKLERRVIARHKSSQFLTFITSVVLLSCAERMSLLFRRFDPQCGAVLDDDSSGQVSALDAGSSSAQPDDWPLSRSPAFYWRQGSSFADLLCMILRLRGIPPTIIASENERAGPVSLQVQRPQAQYGARLDPEQNQATAEWLDATGLTPDDLQAAQLINDLGVPGSPRDWDLKLLVGLLCAPSVTGS